MCKDNKIVLNEQGDSMSTIIKQSDQEDIIVSLQSLYKLINEFH